MEKITTDYLIVGSGAVGMAFADTLLTDSDADIVIVDKHHRPGGHWNIAYPFVRLHQPSAFYGVSSTELSDGRRDQVGLNKGLASLASGAEVIAYFDQVMLERFLPSGRVRYLPMHEYLGDGCCRSLLTGKTFEITARKHVDATYLKTSTPSNHTPQFSIGEDVRFIPLNGLPDLTDPPDRYVVIGAGKTGIDACLWLLENGVDPDDIDWIMPRDGWLLDRANAQPSMDFFEQVMGAQAAQFEALAEASSIDDLFDRLEKAGNLLRVDKTVRPKMFHGATVSKPELEELRRIRSIIRLSRVTSLEVGKITLEHGTHETPANTLFIDCSASAIPNLETKPVFEGDLITPQTVRSYQPVFSASLIAHVEVTRESEANKNRLCSVVPLPNHDTDWIRIMIPFMTNQYQWSQDRELRDWLAENRLDGFARLARDYDRSDKAKKEIMTRLRAASMPAMAKLQTFNAQLEAMT
ncbi:MAG: NAD(P)-binding protein [Ahrensia sp.]|nr:NAD(P)-binding protein [Ahrensia sp.]